MGESDAKGRGRKVVTDRVGQQTGRQEQASRAGRQAQWEGSSSPAGSQRREEDGEDSRAPVGFDSVAEMSLMPVTRYL